MGRGLYGQSESNEDVVNAQGERVADLEGEGYRTSDGNLTELGYRTLLAMEAARDIAASRGERQELEGHAKAKPFIQSIAARPWRNEQRDALENQAELAEQMRGDGFALTNVYSALTAAVPIAYGSRLVQVAAQGIQGAPDHRGERVKGVRRLPKGFGV